MQYHDLPSEESFDASRDEHKRMKLEIRKKELDLEMVRLKAEAKVNLVTAALEKSLTPELLSQIINLAKDI